jgi:hypothetical protein
VPPALANRITDRGAPYKRVYKKFITPLPPVVSAPALQAAVSPPEEEAAHPDAHLPVQQQVDRILQRQRDSRRRAQARGWNPSDGTPVTHQHPLRPAPPVKPAPLRIIHALLSKPLVDRIAPILKVNTYSAPVAQSIKFDFSKKDTLDAQAVLQQQIDATLNCVQPLFNPCRVKLFKELRPDIQDACHQVADHLVWINEHIGEVIRQPRTVIETILRSLKTIGQINFKNLMQNFQRVARQFADLEEFGYFAVALRPTSRYIAK